MNSYWRPFDTLLEDQRIRRCRCGFFLFCNIFIGLYLQRLSADSRSKLPRYRILNNRYCKLSLVQPERTTTRGRTHGYLVYKLMQDDSNRINGRATAAINSMGSTTSLNYISNNRPLGWCCKEQPAIASTFCERIIHTTSGLPVTAATL